MRNLGGLSSQSTQPPTSQMPQGQPSLFFSGVIYWMDRMQFSHARSPGSTKKYGVLHFIHFISIKIHLDVCVSVCVQFIVIRHIFHPYLHPQFMQYGLPSLRKRSRCPKVCTSSRMHSSSTFCKFCECSLCRFMDLIELFMAQAVSALPISRACHFRL